jgi:hypothetical protein
VATWSRFLQPNDLVAGVCGSPPGTDGDLVASSAATLARTDADPIAQLCDPRPGRSRFLRQATWSFAVLRREPIGNLVHVAEFRASG